MWWKIILGIIGGIISLIALTWLALLFVSLMSTLIFKNRLKSLSNSINLLLVERYDTMMNLIKLAKAKKVELKKEDIKAVEKLERIENFQIFSKEERDARILNFSHACHNLLSEMDKNSALKKVPSFLKFTAKVADIEEIYRQKSSKYNSEVTGYNYWINMYSCRWFFKLFKFKPKDSIV